MKELRLKTDAELATLMTELKGQVATGSFSRVFGKTKDTSAAKKAKRTVARIMTMNSEKAAKAKNA